jgi:hypothetical protein
MGITVVGEDPAQTIIRWDGATKATMVHYDAWYSRIARLTLDGAGTAAIALNYGPAFSTYQALTIRRGIMLRDPESPPCHGGGGVGLRSWRISSIRVRTASFPSGCVRM